MARISRRSLRRKYSGIGVAIILVLLAGLGFGYSLYSHQTPEISLSAASVQQIPFQAEAQEVLFEPEAATHEVIEGSIKPNQNFTDSLTSQGLDYSLVLRIVSAAEGHLDFRRLKPGDIWRAELSPEANLVRFEYEVSPEEKWEADLDEEGALVFQKVDVNREVKEVTLKGDVASSLWVAFSEEASGILAQRFTRLFEYTIDFNSETQPGDRFSVIYETIYVDGEYLRDGKILAAKYSGAAGEFYGFYHPENGGYYDENGDNLRRQFLKSPLTTVRITSNFGRRFHPILKTMKMHAGVDYGAPTGTPVNSVADGTVIFSGWKGANGKLISLRHSGGYVTHYAHLSHIDSKVKVGARVKQKQVIGKVGTTGRSTGPHLHFGMTHHGKVINPLKVDFARAEPLSGSQRDTFKQLAQSMMEKL